MEATETTTNYFKHFGIKAMGVTSQEQIKTPIIQENQTTAKNDLVKRRAQR